MYVVSRGEHMSVYGVGMCMEVYACMCTCVEGAEVNVGCLSLLQSD